MKVSFQALVISFFAYLRVFCLLQTRWLPGERERGGRSQAGRGPGIQLTEAMSKE